MRIRLWFCLLAVFVAAGACSSSADEAETAASEGTTSEDTSSEETTSEDTASEGEEADVTGVWEQVIPDSDDCACADGSEFSFWTRQAEPTKVVFYLQGGGSCFDAASCDFENGNYTVTADAEDNPTGAGGIFDFDNPNNPFSDYSFVFVPYCTGDVHIGTRTNDYSDDLSVNHFGWLNGQHAIQHLVDTFPEATEIVVTGSSAGSVPSPLYAGVIGDTFTEAEITVLADASGAYPDAPAVNAVIGTLWGTEASIPDWPENEGLTAATWSLPGLFVQTNAHNPNIRFARYDTAYDEAQQFFTALAGLDEGEDLLTLIDRNEEQIESTGEGMELLSYVAPGTTHTILGTEDFYTLEVEGVSFLDWVNLTIDGEANADVHCIECA